MDDESRVGGADESALVADPETARQLPDLAAGRTVEDERCLAVAIEDDDVGQYELALEGGLDPPRHSPRLAPLREPRHGSRAVPEEARRAPRCLELDGETLGGDEKPEPVLV